MNHQDVANFIWQIADLLRGPYRPPQYERVMLPMTVLRRFDCVLEPTKGAVVKRYEKLKEGKTKQFDAILNKVAGGGRDIGFHNHSELDFPKLKGDPDHIGRHLTDYIAGFSENVRTIFERFAFEKEIEKLEETNRLYLIVSKFADVDLHPSRLDNIQMGLLFEDLIRRFNEAANETAGDYFTPREVIRLMVNLLLEPDEHILTTEGIITTICDPACGTGGMLSESQNWIREHNPSATVQVYGQDYTSASLRCAAAWATSAATSPTKPSTTSPASTALSRRRRPASCSTTRISATAASPSNGRCGCASRSPPKQRKRSSMPCPTSSTPCRRWNPNSARSPATIGTSPGMRPSGSPRKTVQVDDGEQEALPPMLRHD
jgi:hypothetical protein